VPSRQVQGGGGTASGQHVAGYFDEERGVFVNAPEFQLMRFAGVSNLVAAQDETPMVVDHQRNAEATDTDNADTIENLNGAIEWEARSGLLQRLASLFGR
jgi:hypothetical protein